MLRTFVAAVGIATSSVRSRCARGRSRGSQHPIAGKPPKRLRTGRMARVMPITQAARQQPVNAASVIRRQPRSATCRMPRPAPDRISPPTELPGANVAGRHFATGCGRYCRAEKDRRPWDSRRHGQDWTRGRQAGPPGTSDRLRRGRASSRAARRSGRSRRWPLRPPAGSRSPPAVARRRPPGRRSAPTASSRVAAGSSPATLALVETRGKPTASSSVAQRGRVRHPHGHGSAAGGHGSPAGPAGRQDQREGTGPAALGSSSAAGRSRAGRPRAGLVHRRRQHQQGLAAPRPLSAAMRATACGRSARQWKPGQGVGGQQQDAAGIQDSRRRRRRSASRRGHGQRPPRASSRR